MIMTKPINPIRYITQPGVPGGEGTGDDLDPGTDTGGSGAGDNNVGAGDEKSGAGKEKSGAGDEKSSSGEENSGDGDGSVGPGGGSVAKALIALQSLEVPEPMALTFQ